LLSNLRPTTREWVQLPLVTVTNIHVVISGHVTKMAVTPFDPPYPETLCYTQTSWLHVLEKRSHRRSTFDIARISK